ncbi:MAG: efflux RND transporter permease subunit [Gammaproteobacteria bacterium]|nr:efflux RND transporter permease subunit [Gammaproteobacteria bacterium]
MTHTSDTEVIEKTHNLARFFTENRHIAWVLLVAVFLWGYYGYSSMPKRKDPNIPINVASVVTPWPGKTAVEIEQLVTYPVEQAIAENTSIRPLSAKDWGLKSISLPGVSIVQVRLADTVSREDKLKQFNDIDLKLDQMSASLPSGAGPIQFNSGFSDTAALVLELVSPKENEVELSLRARDIRAAIGQLRERIAPDHPGERIALVVAFPRKVNQQAVTRTLDVFIRYLQTRYPGRDVQPLSGAGFAAVDMRAVAGLDDAAIISQARGFLVSRLGLHRFHPDAWPLVVIRDPADTLQQITRIGGDKYSYRELDDFSELIAHNMLNVAQVSKVNRSGVLPEQVTLAYSQEQLASYALQPAQIQDALNARNIPYSGGVTQIKGINLDIDPTGEFTSEDQIGSVVVARDEAGLPVYLRSLVEMQRGYQYPPRFLGYYSGYNRNTGKRQRSRAVSVAVYMRDGEQLDGFQRGVNKALDLIRTHLPDDIIYVRVSDQAQQADDATQLFITALYEAVIMVLLVAFIGFREWRSALLMLLAIPLTMAMTFGMISMLGIDVQQVSIVGLIIALGLLVDDPVVASDAIKRNLELGLKPVIAAWLGPTKLARAIMYATLTNVAAYLPLLLLTGDIGHFIYSLPMVMASALVASRIVSMTFIPLLGYYLLRPAKQAGSDMEELRTQGFTGWYFRVGSYAIENRKKILLASLLILAAGAYFRAHLINSFFPSDVQYLSYADVWLRNNATLEETQAVAEQAVDIIQQVAGDYDRERGITTPGGYLESVSIYVGGSGPKFWFSVISQINQLNYAQLVMRVTDKNVTADLIERWQETLDRQITGATVNVHQLQTQPVEYPVGIRLLSRAALDGPRLPRDIQTLQRLADEAKTILRNIPITERVSDDWGEAALTVDLDVESDRANLAGLTNYDVAYSSALALNGIEMTQLREGDKQIPVVTRLRLSERAELSDLHNLYVYSGEDSSKVPLMDVAQIRYRMDTSKIVRNGHFRAVTVYAYPVPGAYASQVMAAVEDPLADFRESLPPGYEMQITGIAASANDGNSQLKTVLLMCIAMIYIMLVIQFRNAVKPLLVFAAVPYGVCGAFAALYFMNSSFGFMAFLGIIALVGVIVSHVIVLFDFVESAHERGESMRESLLDAGIMRLRPVLITVGATIMALVPLAIHGGPLWQPLCYAQVGGLAFATVVTLILVPVLYSFFVLDLKIVKWQQKEQPLVQSQVPG